MERIVQTGLWLLGMASILLISPAAGSAETPRCKSSASFETGFTWRSDPPHSLLLKPKGTSLCKGQWGEIEFTSDQTLDYRPEDGSWGESTADESVSYEAQLGEDMLLTLDATYGYERLLDENVAGAQLASDDHTLEGSVGLEWDAESLSFKFDIGAQAELHSQTLRDDGMRFDRSRQDYIEPEVALRIAAGDEDDWQPFIELAYVARSYFSDTSLTGVHRHMAGPEFIAGIQKDGKFIDGQLAAILLVRDYAEQGVQSPPVIGPYVDVTIKPNDRTEIIFAAAAQIDQETTGDIRGNPFYSSKLDISYKASEDVKLLGAASFEFEDEPGRGGKITVTPEFKLTWQYSPSIALIAGAGVSWEKSEGDATETSATLQAGWSVKW